VSVPSRRPKSILEWQIAGDERGAALIALAEHRATRSARPPKTAASPFPAGLSREELPPARAIERAQSRFKL
jgi:hypothetical protein